MIIVRWKPDIESHRLRNEFDSFELSLTKNYYTLCVEYFLDRTINKSMSKIYQRECVCSGGFTSRWSNLVLFLRGGEVVLIPQLPKRSTRHFYLENIKKYYFLHAVKKSKFSGQRTESRGRVMVEGVPFFPVRFPGGLMAGENPISSMEKLENSSSAGFFKS